MDNDGYMKEIRGGREKDKGGLGGGGKDVDK